jgi:hypothetical protein
MSDTTFRSVSTTPPADPLPVGDGSINNETTLTKHEPTLEPVEKGSDAIYEALGTDDMLPESHKDNVRELEAYVFDILQQKGIDPTLPAMKREIGTLKYEMGLDPDASLETTLDRMGGVIKSWKSLSFMKDPQEKKQLFFKLANAKSSSDMNRIVFQAMEKNKIWQ